MGSKADRARYFWKRPPKLLKRASVSDDVVVSTCFISPFDERMYVSAIFRRVDVICSSSPLSGLTPTWGSEYGTCRDEAKEGSFAK